MSFVSYLYLRLLISGQMFKITVALETFFGTFKGTKHRLRRTKSSRQPRTYVVGTRSRSGA